MSWAMSFSLFKAEVESWLESGSTMKNVSWMFDRFAPGLVIGGAAALRPDGGGATGSALSAGVIAASAGIEICWMSGAGGGSITIWPGGGLIGGSVPLGGAPSCGGAGIGGTGIGLGAPGTCASAAGAHAAADS